MHKVTTTALVVAMGAFLASAAPARAWVQVQQQEQQIPEPCRNQEDGARCAGIQDDPTDCMEPRCLDQTCTLVPIPDGRTCTDRDQNTCTHGRCQAAKCVPTPVADGTACSDGTPASCGAQACSAGACVPAGGLPDPQQVNLGSVWDVDAEAARPRVATGTAFTDCCVFCDEQTLEALRPTPAGPERHEADGLLPLRRKLCGQITDYGVNDERADPRDILLNLRPAPVQNFPDFVAGLLNTVDTPLHGADALAFGCNWIGGQLVCRCDENACRTRAASVADKAIHAEVTPADEFYGEDARFLPITGGAPSIMFASPQCGYNGLINTLTEAKRNCIACSGVGGGNCRSELEGPDLRRDACVFGVYSYDHGGHSASSHTALCCAPDRGHDHPEIHPFDAVWWQHPEATGWMFAVFQDDSNRYSFPHCGDNNGADWSEAPRDITFRFPFRFPYRAGQQPRQACLRHVRTNALKDGAEHEILPLNVMTAALATTPEVTVLNDGSAHLLEVVEQAGFEGETHVRVEGALANGEVTGHIVVRVAVGCSERAEMVCTPEEIQASSPGSRHNTDDMGSGFYYGQLTFDCSCGEAPCARVQ
jgi:hypothetical protein